MKVAVIGGGINGVMLAWKLASMNCSVTLYEQTALMHATSAASTKMLHGGIRYLEHGQFGLVREALRERSWWLGQAPELTRLVRILIPVYELTSRSKLILGAGVKLYDWLARGTGFPQSRWYARSDVLELLPDLSEPGLKGAWEYWDAQMDDRKLGLWAAEQARRAGVAFRIGTKVESMKPTGELFCGGQREVYDRIVNAAGPWASEVLSMSGIRSSYGLSLVRGTHLIINREIPCGCVLQRWDDRRIVFVLPWQGRALLGTTEVLQQAPEAEQANEFEVAYLTSTFNRFFTTPLRAVDIIESYSGVRPIVRASGDISRMSREYAIERQNKLISVFGGKWTTARSLAEKVTKTVLN